jgi:two-component system sensor histidine kinase PilS (NtrC family)
VRLRWIILLRVAAASALLLALALLQYARSPLRLDQSLPYLQVLGAGTYLATIVYAVALWRRWNPARVAVCQLAGDIALVTALIYVTGGIDSGFSFLYLLGILVGGLVFFGRGAFAMALASCLAYGGVLLAQAARWIRVPALFVTPVWTISTGEVLANFLFNTAVFFVFALLCGYLAEQVRHAGARLEQQAIDLRRLKTLTLEIVSSMGSGLLTVDGDDRITFINPMGERIAGRPLAEVLGMPLPDLLPGLAARRAVKPGRRFEIELTRGDGATLHLGCSFSPLEGEPGGRILIFQDLSEVKAAEERALINERLAAVGRLSAGIAHEIRNPLASIRGSIEVLGHELALEGDQGRLMHIVLRETDRLNHLITDFLQFARPAEVKRQPVPIAELLLDTAEAFAIRAEKTPRVDLAVVAAPGLVAEGDPARIRQVIWNLLLNARDAMPEGGRLRVSARAAEGQGEGRPEGPDTGKAQGPDDPGRKAEESAGARAWIEIRFEDSGVGIPHDVLPRIFEPFFTTKERGTGLGLATVHRIVETHGGSIQVTSEPGRGSAFTVKLPRASVPDRAAQAGAHEARPDTIPS